MGPGDQPAPPTMRHLTSLTRERPDEAAYENFEPLIEVVVHFLLPTGKTRALRALVDTGATDNFVSKSTIEEFKLSCEPFPTPTTVAVGTDDATTEALGATEALTIQLGMLCKHKTNFTVLPLADYDVVLGRPFQIDHQRGQLVHTNQEKLASPPQVDISTYWHGPSDPPVKG